MLKIVISSFEVFYKLYGMSFIRKFVVFDIRSLNSINSPENYAFAVSTFTTESKHGKTTNANRFLDLDVQVMKYLSLQSEIKIHDVGVSSGVTSCELLDRVKELNKPFQFVISDKYANFFTSGSNVLKVYSADKYFIYGYFFGILADKNVSNYFFLSKCLYFLLKLIPRPNVLGKIQLFDFETKRLVKASEINLIEYDLFGKNFIDGISFLRCMNVLNANSWFSLEQIIIGLQDLNAQLIDGGIFLVGRTDESTNKNNASFYKKINGKLVHLEDFNLGSDIKNIIEEVLCEN